jgi:hypothetical protein
MTVNMVLYIIGWVFLVASWVIPSWVDEESKNKHFIGGVLAAIACGVFLSGLVIQLMK